MIRKLLILSICIPMFCGGQIFADECKPSGDLRYICGPVNAEDILPLGNTKWLITSGMNGQLINTHDKGHIYLVNRRDKTFEELFPGKKPVFRPDKKMFSACPAPIDPENFSAHGLALKQISTNRFHLYVTSHGEREAIEVFEIDAQGRKPTISWTGCVPLPDNMFSNSVAILADGGFVVTKFFDPKVPDSFNSIFEGKITGCIYEWHPGGRVKVIEGTELSGANGIAVSKDNKWVYVAASGTREIIRFNRTQSPVKLSRVRVSIQPDNIHWGDNGMLYTTGSNYVPPDECKSSDCNTGWSILRIDPETLKTVRVTGFDQTATLQKASTAIPVGNEIWIGTYSGNRIGYLPEP